MDYELAIETAHYYDLDRETAAREVRAISEIVRGSWRKIAKSYGISREVMEYMSPAFALER